MLNRSSAARAIEAARVYKILGSPWMISSGGVGPGSNAITSAVLMRSALVNLGVPPERILLESTSRNTRDEAVNIAPMLRALGVERFVLVTSDTHMRRSLATFRAVGLNPLAAIARDPRESQPRGRSFFPTQQGLVFSSAVAHEYVGLGYYGIRGWLRF